LYALLSLEYKKARPAQCTACHLPFPYLVERADSASPNWFVRGLSECPHGCHRLMAEIVARLWEEYDLQDLTATPSEFPDDRMRRGKDPVWNQLARQKK
jgi:hypothetical protein